MYKRQSDAFEAKRAALLEHKYADPEDPEEYLTENVFWVPRDARWSRLQANAKQKTIGKLVDDAMLAIEASNASLKGVLPKDYARPALNKVMLGELIDLVSGIGMGEEADKSKDILGRVYEYFLGGFAGAEGKRGGEFYTPRSVVRVLVDRRHCHLWPGEQLHHLAAGKDEPRDSRHRYRYPMEQRGQF